MALYKKYRPQSLDEVVGNAMVIEKLRTALANPSTNNASLYTGETGTGKTTLGLIEAKHKMGVESFEELKSQLGYHEICSADKGGVDYARQVKQIVSSGFRMDRVFFFDESSWETDEAQGVLLKTIEDAPKNIHFILCTSAPGKLSPALKSRCTRYHLEPLTADQIVGLLAETAAKEGKAVNPDTMVEIARLSEGRSREALVMLEEIISLPIDKQLGALRTEDLATEQPCRIGRNRKGPYPHGAMNYSQTLGGSSFKTKAACLNAIESLTYSSMELHQKTFPPLKKYLGPFLYEGALIMIFAAAGAGKTFFVMLLTTLLTRINGKGKSIGPLTVLELCKILVIDGEMQPRFLQKRSLMTSGPLGEEDPDNPLIYFSSDDLCASFGSRANIADECWQDAIFSYLKKNRDFRILVLDNLASLMPGVSENSKSAFDSVNQWLLSLRTLGVCVIIVHHANKKGGYRGHSCKIDNLDTVIGLKGLKGPDELCFMVQFLKYRHGEKGEGQSFGLEAVKHPDNPEWLLWQEVPCDNFDSTAMRDEHIMAGLLVGDNTQKEIAKMFGVSQPTVSNVKKIAIEKGFLTTKGQITDLGEEFLRKYDSGCVE